MIKQIRPIRGVRTTITAPPSGEYTNYSIVAASFAEGKSIIKNPLIQDEQLALINSFKSIGVVFEKKENLVVYGKSQGWIKPEKSMALTDFHAKFLTVLYSLFDGYSTINSKVTIGQEYFELIKALGVDAFFLEDSLGSKSNLFDSNNSEIKGGIIKVKGGFIGGKIENPCLVDLTPICLCSPYSQNGISFEKNPRLDLCLEVIEKFKIPLNKDTMISIPKSTYQPTEIVVDGDYFFSAFFLLAAAIHGEIIIKGLNLKSVQVSHFFLTCLHEMGCKMVYSPSEISLTSSKMKNIVVDASNIPELIPLISIAASFANGETHITNITPYAVYVEDLVKNLKRMNINHEFQTNGLSHSLVIGKSNHKACEIDSVYPQTLMAFSIVGLKIPGIKIKNAEIVPKMFWDQLDKV